jgi:glucose/arabinose dehydrogenase
VNQPYANHNGGGLVVTSDGVLWIGLGDGGSGGDPKGNAQNQRVLLGKILRIKPTPTATKPYEIPAGNVTGKGARPEIWAFGLRNPWRFDIDEKNARIWIGDVGQNEYEEVNVASTKTVNANFGWKLREGFHAFKGGKLPKGAIDPLFNYKHGDLGCSVTGGVVYQGTDLPELTGAFLYSDYCNGDIRIANAGDKKTTSLGIKAETVSSFGTDGNREAYVTSLDGAVYKLARS